MYRFVLLSVGFHFNLNMVYLYLTISPFSQSLFVLHYAGGGLQEEASIKPVRAHMIVCVAALKTRADLSFCSVSFCPC